MKTGMKIFLGCLVLLLAMGMVGIGRVMAFDSGGTPAATGSDTITWTGQGADEDGNLDTVNCPSPDLVPEGINPNHYLLWIFTTDGGSASNPVLTLGGSGSGTYYPDTAHGSTFHIFTPYFTPDSSLTAQVNFTVDETGRGSWILTISHGCPGGEDLSVSKTVETSFTRTHYWSIAKFVDPTDIYLYIPGAVLALEPPPGRWM